MMSCAAVLAGCFAVLAGCAAGPSPERDSGGVESASRGSSGLYSAADVVFMQDMMIHHAQAIEMSRLAPDRTERRALLLLARRIAETQEFEIDLMRRWLERRDEEAPYVGDAVEMHDMGHMGGMAGMATQEQMTRLADSEGTEFDRLYLQLMIRHHEGALAMMADLANEPEAGQEPEMYLIVSDIDADQRAEIARMRRLLDELQ